MGIGAYVGGAVLTCLCLGTLGVGAHRLRSRLAPLDDGPVAWIADGVTLVGLLTLVLEVVGVIGVLDRLGVVIGCLLGGAITWIIGSQRPASRAAPTRSAATAPPPATNRRRRVMMAVALAATAVVAAAWIGWTIYAYRHGMETIDTIWYHMPAAARFVQLGNIRHLQYFDDGSITVFYPANSELIHAFGIVLFGGRDALSPAINLGWAVAVAVCAWAIGRPWGREPQCLLACLPVLGTPGVVDTQPGGAYDDIVCLALLLASIAVIVNGHRPRGRGQLKLQTSALAAVAAGLALGTKFTMITPAITLGLACVLIAGRGRRRRHAVAWASALLLVGGYWYLRDAIAVGNPLPALSHIGPLSLPAPRTARTYTVWDYLTDGSVWQQWYIPGLRESLGLAWWALILGSIAGAITATVQRRDPRLRVVGGVTLLAGFSFLITPQLLGIPGAPIFFVDNVRYCVVPLAVGLILLPVWPPLRGARGSLAWVVAAVLVLLFTVLDPGVWRSGFPVRPFASALHGGPALGGAAIAAVMLVAGETWLWQQRRLRAWAGRLTRGARLLVTAVASATVVLAGWAVSNTYANHRYRNSPPFPTVYAWAQHVQNARIGVIGLPNQYPLTGADESNWVQFIGIGRRHRGYAEPATCGQWRTAVDRGRFGYVVVTAPFITSVSRQPELRWTQSSPNAHPILYQFDGKIELAVVYRIKGGLDPTTCPA